MTSGSGLNYLCKAGGAHEQNTMTTIVVFLPLFAAHFDDPVALYRARHVGDRKRHWRAERGPHETAPQRTEKPLVANFATPTSSNPAGPPF